MKTLIVKYIGEGSYIDGIPARDLTEAEWETYKETILLCPTAHDLYKLPKVAPVVELEVTKPVAELAGIKDA